MRHYRDIRSVGALAHMYADGEGISTWVTRFTTAVTFGTCASGPTNSFSAPQPPSQQHGSIAEPHRPQYPRTPTPRLPAVTPAGQRRVGDLHLAAGDGPASWQRPRRYDRTERHPDPIATPATQDTSAPSHPSIHIPETAQGQGWGGKGATTHNYASKQSQEGSWNPMPTRCPSRPPTTSNTARASRHPSRATHKKERSDPARARKAAKTPTKQGIISREPTRHVASILPINSCNAQKSF